MRIAVTGFGLLILALAMGAVTPASAEFFNCNQKPGQLLYSYSGTPSQYGSRSYSRHYTNDYSAQSSRRRYQSHATYSSSRRHWDDRSRW